MCQGSATGHRQTATLMPGHAVGTSKLLQYTSALWLHSGDQPVATMTAGSKTSAFEHVQQLQQCLHQQQKQEAVLVQQVAEMTIGLQQLQEQQHALNASLTQLSAAGSTLYRLQVSCCPWRQLLFMSAC